MNGVNLIPAPRLRARRRALQIRVWAAASISLGIVLSGGYALLWSMWKSGDADLAAEASKLAQEIAAGKKEELSGQAKVKEARAALDAAREVSDQPDWGVLLAFACRKLGPDAALDSCRLEPAKRGDASGAPGAAPTGPGPAKAVSRAGRYTLLLSGVARTQDSASNLALRLKQSGLFEGVALMETRRTKFRGEDAVSFRVECSIAGAGGGGDN